MRHWFPSTRLMCFVALSALIHLLIIAIAATLSSPKVLHSFPLNREGGFIVTIMQSTAAETITTKSSPLEAAKNSFSLKTIVQAAPLPKEYYEIRELDKAIRPLSDIQPQYPPLPNISGKMTLDLYLDESGTVQSVFPKDSTLPEDYTQAAVTAFMNKNFEPGLVHQVPVKVHLRISLELIPETNSVERN